MPQSSYLCAVEGHPGEHSLGHAGPLQLIPDLLVDFRGHLGGRRVAPGMVARSFGGTPGDGRVVEELLIEALRVLVGQQAAHGQLLVDEVGHGELLANQLRGELGREEPTWPQQGLQRTRRRRRGRRRHLPCAEGGAVVEGAMRRWLLLGQRGLLKWLRWGLRVPGSCFEEGAAGTQVGELSQVGRGPRPQHAEVRHVVPLNWSQEKQR